MTQVEFDKLIQTLITNIQRNNNLGISVIYTKLKQNGTKDKDIETAIYFHNNKFLGGEQ